MLLDVYCQIGEPDGSYGACILFSPENELTKRLYEHQNEWQELFCELYDINNVIMMSLCNYDIIDLYDTLKY